MKTIHLALILLFILITGYTSGQTSNCLSPNGLAGWWPFCGNANDESGHGNNGTVTTATLTTDKFGGMNSAYNFNGTNSVITVPDNIALRPTSLTLSCFICPSRSFSGTWHVVTKNLGTSIRESYAIVIDQTNFGGQPRLLGFISDLSGWGTWVTYPFNPTSGQWYHLAFTFNDTTNTTKLYLDGNIVAQGTETKSVAYDTKPLQIGSEFENGNQTFFFPGKIDNVGLWDRVLTPQEVQQISSQSIFCYVPQPPLVTALKDTVCPDEPPVLSTNSTATNIQWQYSLTGTGFTDLSGLTGLVCLDIPNQSAYYRVVAGNGTCADTSAPYQITVESAPSADFTSTVTGLDVSYNSFGATPDVVEYDWDFGDGIHSPLENPTHTYSYPDTFLACLYVYNEPGCVNIACHELITEIATNVTEENVHDALMAYPNPADDRIYIRSDELKQVRPISILNLLGEEIKSFSPSDESVLNVSDVPEGIYFLRINIGDRMISQKQMILHSRF